LHTVCEEARCPNLGECWTRGVATFMIGGDTCTRACRFCAVRSGRPAPLDPLEPVHVGETVAGMGLSHIVITAVARDDLPDEGAAHFAETIAAIRRAAPGVTVEVLTPDFHAREECLRIIGAARPDIFNHNLETVRRLTPAIRSKARYDRSLQVLDRMRAWYPAIPTKSGIMLGLGEHDAEIRETLRDLRVVGCEILTIGQYLQPTKIHHPVVEYVAPERFQDYQRYGESIGFRSVFSGPFVRSSYMADQFARAGDSATASPPPRRPAQPVLAGRLLSSEGASLSPTPPIGNTK
ncbi:MAG: lipoyl synthase, partial [Deltaproteobacteria bacterium]|nr:lipoyl synthase [Deltaproteobacteria bacterium]